MGGVLAGDLCMHPFVKSLQHVITDRKHQFCGRVATLVDRAYECSRYLARRLTTTNNEPHHNARAFRFVRPSWAIHELAAYAKSNRDGHQL